MEPYNKDIINNRPESEQAEKHNRSGRIMGGLIIVVIGVLLLARRAGADIPYWIFSVEMIIIAIGLYIGARHNFKGFGWTIPVIFGAILLVDDIYPYVDFSRYIWPMAVIAAGLYIMFKPRKKNNDGFSQTWDAQNANATSLDDYLDATAVFGSVKRNIISKNFKGGEAVTVFGGTEINLSQADLNGRMVLELTQVFGGTKLIVPPHWKIQSEEIVAVLGGVEDKRVMMSDPSTVDQNKVLILRGTCVFGGIDIKSF